MLGSAQIVELAEARIGALERGVALHGIADAEVAEDDEDAAAGEPRLVIGLVDPSLRAGRVVLDLAAVLGRPP